MKLYFIKNFAIGSGTELQIWSAEKQLMPKLVTYNLFKDSRDCEPCLKINIPRRLVITFSRFRTGSHNLEIEIGKHHKLAKGI